MGHKLPGARNNYFDLHDVDEIEKKYGSCNFSREIRRGKVALEEIEKLRLELEKLKKQVPHWDSRKEIVEALKRHGLTVKK